MHVIPCPTGLSGTRRVGRGDGPSRFANPAKVVEKLPFYRPATEVLLVSKKMTVVLIGIRPD